HNHLLLGVDAVDLKHVLGDIQTDRGNLHLDGSPHVIRYNDHSMAPRCRERAPSTTSKPDQRTAKAGGARSVWAVGSSSAGRINISESHSNRQRIRHQGTDNFDADINSREPTIRDS